MTLGFLTRDALVNMHNTSSHKAAKNEVQRRVQAILFAAKLRRPTQTNRSSV